MDPSLSKHGKQQPDVVSRPTSTKPEAIELGQAATQTSPRRSWLRNPLRTTVPPVPTERRQSPELGANLISKITFDWMNSLLLVGYRRTLTETDFPQLNPSRKTGPNNAKIRKQLHERSSKGEKHPLLSSLMYVFWREYWLAGASLLISTCVQGLSPLVLKYIIQYASDSYYGDAPPIGRGIGLVLALVAMLTISAFAINSWVFRGLVVGGMARASLIGLIYSKSLVVSGRAKAGGISPSGDTSPETAGHEQETTKNTAQRHDYEGWSNGKVMNLMSTDTTHIDQATMWSHMLWTVPLQLVIVVTLLVINIGVSALAGLALFAILMPLLAWSASQLARRRSQMKKITDKRLSLTQEILKSVRFVKFFSWESSFLQQLKSLRSKEVRSIQTTLGIRSAMNAVSVSAPILAAMLAFITYSLTHTDLGAANIFSSLALFYGLRIPLNLLPMVIAQSIDAYVSLERIQDYLLAEEEQEKRDVDETQVLAFELSDAQFTWEIAIKTEDNSPSDPVATTEDSQPGLDLEKGTHAITQKMSEKSKAFCFEPLSLSISRKELVAVVGGVASGKTSLLAALAGVMRKTAGSITQGAGLAYCPQQAWIQNSSVRENITFGRPFDQSWYERVVDACALGPDFDMLPDGDRTEVGEFGITLSGGQKQRLNIARAIYFDAPIVLLDDPLSAVDSQVGRHIFNEAISGLLQGKCRVLATHQLHVLSRCDRIIWMQNGRIESIDTFDNLMANNSGFVEMLSMTATHERTDESKVDTVDVESPPIDSQPTGSPKPEPVARALIQKEEKGEKGIKWKIYVEYMRASGSFLIAPLAIFLLCTAQVSNVMSTVWLGYWTSDSLAISNNTYIAVYVSLAIAQAFLMFGFAMALTIGGTNASKKFLHRAMGSVLSAPTYFFDTTPLGRIVNRFSKDVDVMDNFLSEAIRMYLFTLVQILSIFVLIVVYFPEFLAALVPLCCLYYFVASYYRASAREIKRNEAVLRSDVFSKFSEGLSGTATIRAYGMQDLYETKINESIDTMDSVYFLTFSNQAWLSIRLDIIGILLTFIVGMLVITNRFNLKPSTAGLILTYMLQVIGMVQFLVKQQTEVENSMNSTERVYSYGRELPQEHDTIGDPSVVPEVWPEKGEIQFKSAEMRYRPDLPLTLKGLDLQIKGGERIGVVGRTGAGKSSIMSCLFRLTELSGGSIEIDGLDISQVNLHRLRSSLSIIPQDPTLFRGTIRSNLDPFNEHNDLRLWQALQQAYLIPQSEDPTEKLHEVIETSPSDRSGGIGAITLDTTVQEEGLNFSLGQRQLMALARALVRGSRIIVCDEATSSIDEETDRKIQETMAVGFKGRTVLCIAHRLLTIVNYDRIVVIDNGRISELGKPFELWQSGGVFREMCDKGQITRDAFNSY
ncbi:ABC transporter family protein [Phlyctema vagabunda]|uniref:ABC transporter family protein n=1 Tax=Phlyctema vagabunda TaxID=108571 RepID=A0ABR4P3V9_9HELO